MTDAEINVAIAEACGWSEIEFTGVSLQGIPPNPKHGLRPAPAPIVEDDRQWYWVPNYTADLNAMHEAEATLGFHGEFEAQLTDVCCEVDTEDSFWPCIHAAARQRAEAFLRTLGKWRGE